MDKFKFRFYWANLAQKVNRFIHLCCCIHIYPTPPLRQDATQGQFLSGFKQVWVQSFLFPRLVASPRLKNLVCATILPIAGGGIIGFIPFPRLLVQCEMQSASSRIWTRVVVSISYDNNQSQLLHHVGVVSVGFRMFMQQIILDSAVC